MHGTDVRHILNKDSRQQGVGGVWAYSIITLFLSTCTCIVIMSKLHVAYTPGKLCEIG